MNDTKYNGWTNYATWRVNLEIFDGGNYDGYNASALRQEAHDIIYETTTEGFARDYAIAFLDEVNWYEIEKHYQEESEATE